MARARAHLEPLPSHFFSETVGLRFVPTTTKLSSSVPSLLVVVGRHVPPPPPFLAWYMSLFSLAWYMSLLLSRTTFACFASDNDAGMVCPSPRIDEMRKLQSIYTEAIGRSGGTNKEGHYYLYESQALVWQTIRRHVRSFVALLNGCLFACLWPRRSRRQDDTADRQQHQPSQRAKRT